jgi:hypothetical protein
MRNDPESPPAFLEGREERKRAEHPFFEGDWGSPKNQEGVERSAISFQQKSYGEWIDGATGDLPGWNDHMLEKLSLTVASQ